MSDENKIVVNNSVVLITEVRANDYNPKKKIVDDEATKVQYEKVKKSLEVFGQIDPILVRELEKEEDGVKYEIINGFHRFTAMKELKFTEIEIKNLGIMSRSEAISRALSTEEIHIPLDQIEVAGLLKELNNDLDFDLGDLPFTNQEIADKIEMLDFDWDKFNEEINEDEIGEEELNGEDGVYTITINLSKEELDNYNKVKDLYPPNQQDDKIIFLEMVGERVLSKSLEKEDKYEEAGMNIDGKEEEIIRKLKGTAE